MIKVHIRAEGNTETAISDILPKLIPVDCCVGVCGTCRCKLLSGTIYDYSSDSRITGEAIILTCCSYPITDCTLEIKSK